MTLDSLLLYMCTVLRISNIDYHKATPATPSSEGLAALRKPSLFDLFLLKTINCLPLSSLGLLHVDAQHPLFCLAIFCSALASRIHLAFLAFLRRGPDPMIP